MSTFRVTLAAAAAIVATASHPALAKDERVVLEPSSQWNVDFGESKCRLARSFGADDQRHLLFFELYGPASKFGFTVAGPSLERYSDRRPVNVRFFAGQEAQETQPMIGTVDSIGKALIYSGLGLVESEDDADKTAGTAEEGLPRLDVEMADKVGFASFDQRGRELVFKTGPLGEAFKIMNQCTDSLMRDWGLDVDAHLTATKLPRWINKETIARRIGNQYPSKALNRGEQGIMRMRVMVDETGSVTRCVIKNATEQQSLESPACKSMEKAQFEPALDAQGQPMASFHITPITYKMSS